MKISETMNEIPITGAEDAIAERGPAAAIAPWWHTALMVVVILGVSLLSGLESKTKSFSGSHLQRYLFTMVWEWLLAGLAWWGIWMRGVPVRRLLGERRGGVRAWAKDLGIALIFWVMAMMVLAAVATVLRLAHLISVQKTVVELAPHGGLEAMVWIALSITAGMTEEFVFRGYMLQQFAALGKKKGILPGVIASSLLFGMAHGYEGAGGIIAISAYGAMFCVLALIRRSLRAGMMAHAWHDSATGIALAIAKHFRAI